MLEGAGMNRLTYFFDALLLDAYHRRVARVRASFHSESGADELLGFAADERVAGMVAAQHRGDNAAFEAFVDDIVAEALYDVRYPSRSARGWQRLRRATERALRRMPAFRRWQDRKDAKAFDGPLAGVKTWDGLTVTLSFWREKVVGFWTRRV
jgi:hypothetical protein